MAIISEIFKKFEAFNFANGFAIMRGDEEFHVDVWSRHLDGLTQREIDRGVLESAKLNWAPSVGAFRSFCRPQVTNAKAYKNSNYIGLNNYKPGSVIGQVEMAKIRKILNMPQVDRDENGKLIVDGKKKTNE